ncbi:MAG: SUMF1/EgtB/PvdO family nonheme iron enzyme [Verrucomicrobiae bacterium]|nr:SUMF1/EgtB/PvdO family nonheme iron enzyme [Verrucomicrobiae bacterium]
MPTDREWSAAVGLRRNEDKTEFPWGNRWPPPEGAGNLGDTTFKAGYATLPFIEGYTDGYKESSPVMSFQPNKLGLYDMAGNLNEWCEDLRPDGKARIMRGSNATDANRSAMISAFRAGGQQDSRNNGWVGFRIVLETTD